MEGKPGAHLREGRALKNKGERPWEGSESHSQAHHQSPWVKLRQRTNWTFQLQQPITPRPRSLPSAWLQFLTPAINTQPKCQQEFDTFQWPKRTPESKQKEKLGETDKALGSVFQEMSMGYYTPQKCELNEWIKHYWVPIIAWTLLMTF